MPKLDQHTEQSALRIRKNAGLGLAAENEQLREQLALQARQISELQASLQALQNSARTSANGQGAQRTAHCPDGNEVWLRGLTSLSSDWYWETDENYRFVQLSGGDSDEQRQQFGEFIGKTRWEIDCRTSNALMWSRHREQLERRESFRNFEYEREGADGEVTALCISGEPMFAADGRFTGYRGVGSDITLRKQTETALRLSETRFRTLFGALAEAVMLRDAAGRLIDCNASAERLFGKSLEHVKGAVHLVPEWARLREDGSPMPDDETPSNIARQTGKSQMGTVVYYRKPDNSLLCCLFNVQLLFDETTGQVSGSVTSVTDITKRKQAEMEIVRLNVELENRVTRRTAQLQAANRELEAFSYSVAHDLRSPLSTIHGFCSMLQKLMPADADERAHHYIDRIRSGVVRMGELTDGLLSLAQLSRTSLEWQAVDLSAEALRVLSHWSETEPARTVRITVQPGLQGRGDLSLLRQVLENLIANAWKFTAGKPCAEITVGQKAGAGSDKVYFVADNGAGFDMAYVDKLFGTFQRLHSAKEFAGTGIGLATVKRIIQRHDGRIWAESVLGQGSTFYFTLGGDQQLASNRQERGNDSGTPPAQVPESSSAGAAGLAGHPGTDNDVFLINANNQFSNAFKHAAVGMALMAIGSRRLHVNSAFCQMLGYSEAELLSRITTRDVTHPDDMAWDKLQRKRALAGEIESYQWEKRYIHKSGEIVWGHLTCSLVRDADRKPLQFIVQVQDITARKRAEKTLKESEERFRALTELSSDWYWEQDENFRFTEISDGAFHSSRALANAKPSIGKTRWEIDSSGLNESAWLAHRALLEQHKPFRDFEVKWAGNDGKIIHTVISGIPVFDLTGRFSGYRGTGRDTTQLHQITDALSASESQLRNIIDAVPVLIAYVDSGQRFVFHNRTYEEIMGLSHEQVHGKHMREVIGDAAYANIRHWVEDVLSGYPVSYQKAQKNGRGEERDLSVSYFPRYGECESEGQVIGFYLMASDITELKRIDRMKSEFVSTVSHELRTPLTSIRGSLGLISGGAAGEVPDGIKKLLDIAKSNCERLIRLINDILDIEKIESNKLHFELADVQLRPLLMQALAANEAYGADKAIKLSLDFPGQDRLVHVDSDKLMQVMTNLLSNAMKFSPQGASVNIRVADCPFGVRIEVRDEGPGIPAEFRHRIFQKFSQADSSDTRQKGGSGLGLSISKALIERFGGRLGFQGNRGAGTTFFFELPRLAEGLVQVAAQ